MEGPDHDSLITAKDVLWLPTKKRVCRHRRWSIWLVGIFTAVLVTAAWGFPFMSNVLTVTLTVVDDHGEPVSYATVGSVWTPYGDPLPERLTPADVTRILMRDPSAWEYYNRFASPLLYLKFPGLTDTAGVLTERIDYEESAGRGSHRPDHWTIAYGVYRQGYEPGQVVVQVGKDDKELRAQVVLKRAADYRSPDTVYLRTLYETRREISDWRANENITRENQTRLERLRIRLEQAGEAAIAANDRKAAAAIYYWVSRMPEIHEQNGHLIGYAQSNPESPRNVAALRKAAELDSENVYLQARWLVTEHSAEAQRWHGHELTDAQWVSYQQRWLERARTLDRRAGEHLTYDLHTNIAYVLGFLGWEAKRDKRKDDALRYFKESLEKLLWVQKFEPTLGLDGDIRATVSWIGELERKK